MKKVEKFDEVLSLLELARVQGKEGAVADIEFYANENQVHVTQPVQNPLPK